MAKDKDTIDKFIEKSDNSKVRHKVVMVTDYFNEAREKLGPDNIHNNAIAIIYDRHKVIAALEHKGELKFVVEA